MRLGGYDYSQEGMFFVTICTLGRELLLVPDYASEMVEKYWRKLSEKFPGTEIGEYVIMPNHIHGILLIVGADPCVGPYYTNEKLPRMVQWFKTFTTNAYIKGIKDSGWQPFDGKLWQRGYHEKIIRTETELRALSEYIRANPDKWDEDTENPMMTERHNGQR